MRWVFLCYIGWIMACQNTDSHSAKYTAAGVLAPTNTQWKNMFLQQGVASYYANFFQGLLTANGEYYDKNKLTAAHKTLPLGTVVAVTHHANNKSIIVRINDRGPYIGKRIIDLSYAAADSLDMIEKGTAEVTVRVVNSAFPMD